MSKNLEYICFNQDELLTFDDFDFFLDANPIKKAEIISDRLIEYLLISNNILYLYNSNSITYKKIEQSIQDYLLMIARKLIVNSYENSTDKEKRLISKMYDTEKLFNLNYYRDFILDIYHMITINNITFNDNCKYETHYRNGYYNLKSNKFQSRDCTVHYITEYIDKDYNIITNKSKVSSYPPSDDEEEQEEKEYVEIKHIKLQFDRSEIKRIANLI